jgi:curved DNA-binding protein CbpA
MFRLNESYKRLMHGFKKLFEARPPTEAEIKKAYDIFGLKPGDDLSGLDKLWKELARKNHPDLGGDPEKMKDINWAKDILQNFGVGFRGGKKAFDWDDLDRRTTEFHASAEKNISQLMEKLLGTYQDYFEQYIPGLEPQKIISKHNRNYAVILSEWKTKEGDSSVILRITANWADSQKGGLGVSSDPMENINISYATEVYHDGKRYKVSQRDFGWSKLSGQLSDPKEVFPEKAMKRIASKTRAASKFVRRDAVAFIQNQLDGRHTNDNNYLVPIDDKTSLFLLRSVFMRQPAWNLNGIYEKNNAGYHTKRIKYDSHTFPETMEAFKQLKDYVQHLRKGGDSSEVKKFFPKQDV